MYFILDFLIKKQEFCKVGIEECFVEWGEEKLSQEPKKFSYASSLVFHENTDMQYYVNLVKNELNVLEFTSLTLEGDKLEEVDKLANDREKNIYDSEVISFINKLYEHLSTFCIIKLRDEECIDEVRVITKAIEAIDTFVNSMQRNSPKGIVIIKK